jgi:hypothetical protein
MVLKRIFNIFQRAEKGFYDILLCLSRIRSRNAATEAELFKSSNKQSFVDESRWPIVYQRKQI